MKTSVSKEMKSVAIVLNRQPPSGDGSYLADLLFLRSFADRTIRGVSEAWVGKTKHC